MPFIGRAWKANVNVWKIHLTSQSVFNHGECMIHVDKNADGHVVDQNVDRISREIAYVSLSRRIRSKYSSYMQPFFVFLFFFGKKKWIQDMLTSGHDKKRILVMILNFGHASQRSNGFEILDMLPRGLWIWNLDMLPRGPMDWFWTCFLEVRWFDFGCAY